MKLIARSCCIRYLSAMPSVSAPQIVRGPFKYIYLAIGTLSLILGIIGAFLPLLPTTVFLLISAYCYERGSERFHNWLIAHRWFGPPILDWRRHQVIRPQAKWLATAMMALSAFFVLGSVRIPVWGKLSFAILLLGVLSFIWSRKSRV